MVTSLCTEILRFVIIPLAIFLCNQSCSARTIGPRFTERALCCDQFDCNSCSTQLQTRVFQADNCLVDENWRTKLGDFGTGKLVSTLAQDTATAVCERPKGFRGRGMTMTAATGSWLWMAPELLGGRRVSTLDATPLDVYRWVLDYLIAESCLP